MTLSRAVGGWRSSPCRTRAPRNDCVACRERDADFHLLGAERNPPGKREARYCRACIGETLVVLALHGPGRGSPADPLTVTIELLPPGGGSW